MVDNDNNKIGNLKKSLIQNIEELMDFVSQSVSERTMGIVFATMNLTYAYGQSWLKTDTSKACNFSWMGGTMTSTYKLKINFYGLTTMRA